MKLKPPEGWGYCKGIFVGGCVERGEGSSFRATAHCHNTDLKCFPFYGWICVRSARRIGQFQQFHSDGWDGTVDKPSQLLLHEYAHLLTPNQGHTAEFYRRLREIGGRITKADRYQAPKAVQTALSTSKAHKARPVGGLTLK